MARAGSAPGSMATHVLAPSVVVQAGVDYLHPDHVAGAVVSAKLVALGTQAVVGAPGVATLMSTGVRCLALVLVRARDLVGGEDEARGAGTHRSPTLSTTFALAPTIGQSAGVDQFTALAIIPQLVP